jgi:hypothetical protein
MSVRTRSIAAGVVTAALLSAGAAIAGPTAATATAATATTPAPPQLPLALTVTADTPATPLQPGGPAGSVTIKVSNPGARTVDLNIDNVSLASGPLALKPGWLSVKLTPQGATPATGVSFQQTPLGVFANVFPKDHPAAAFEVPAHTTFAWTLSIGAARSWAVNDGQIGVAVAVEEQGRTMHEVRAATLRVGNGRPGGPVLVSLSGATSLAPGRPATEKLTVTNHSGARIAEPLHFVPVVATATSPSRMDLRVYQWVGAKGTVKAHWQDVTRSGFVLGSLADGVSATVELQVRVVSYNEKAASETAGFRVSATDLSPSMQSEPFQLLTVHR